MESALIEHVREHLCLYDIKSKFYRDQTLRQEAWEEIAREMNLTADTVKTMWAKLRNAFIAAKKRRKTKTGQAAKKIAAWKFDQEMSFLTPYLEMRETQSNLEKRRIQEDEEAEYSDSDDQTDNIDKETMEPESQCQQQWRESYQPRPVPHTNPTSRRKTSQNPAQEMIQIMKQNANMRMKRFEEKTQANNLDETDIMFYLSMSKTVKRLPPVEQAKIRMTLCQLVSEAEIRTIEGTSGRYSTSTSSLGSTPPMVSPVFLSHDSNLHQASTSKEPPAYQQSFSPPTYMSQYQEL